MLKKILFFGFALSAITLNSCKNTDLAPEESGGGGTANTVVIKPLASANWNNTFTSAINYFPPVSGPLSSQPGGNSMCTDAAGNVYIVGALKGSMDVDPGPGVTTISQGSTTGMSLFLAKYNAAGSYQWAKVIDANVLWDSYTKEVAPAIALDNSGNVYVYNTFSGTVNFGGGNQAEAYRLDANNTKQSTYSAFLAKYNTSGSFQWGKVINDQSAVSPVGRDIVSRDLRVDGSGNIYIIGQYIGDLKFTSGSTSFSFGVSHTYNGQSPGNSTFIAKLDNSGNVIWATNLFNSSIYSNNLALDNNNDVIVIGTQNGTGVYTDVNGKTFYVGNPLILNSFCFLAKISNSSGGKIAWFKQFTNDFNYISPSALAAANDGSIFFAGPSSGKNLLYKLNTNGEITWTKVLTPTTADNTNTGTLFNGGKFAMTLNANNDIFLAGSYSGTIMPTGATTALTGTSKVNIYMAKYHADGSYVWAKSFSGPAANDVLELYYLNVDQSNHLNVYGDFSSSALNNTNKYLFLSQVNDAN